MNKDELIKSSCESCNAKVNLEMHHPDYNEPLSVVTLCKACHEEIHSIKSILKQ